MQNASAHSSSEPDLHNLEQLLQRLKEIPSEGERVSIDDMLDAVGRRSFGPVLLLMGLIPASPLSGIPVLPTVAAVLVFIVVLQLLTGHHHFWLPQFILKRSVPRDKFIKAMDFMEKPAAWVDKFIHPRLQFLTRGAAVYGVAFICALLTFLMPPLELIPFGNTTTGIALSIFGLALIANDGALVLLGTALFAGAATLLILNNPLA